MSEKSSRRDARLNVKISDETHRGTYANQMVVAHTRDEFVMDFLVTFPPGPQVVARLVTAPGHLKRILLALEDNLRQYEEKYGPVEPAPAPDPAPGPVN
jgi:hypothetical protein